MKSIVVGADICPIGDNAPLFAAGDAPRLFGDLLDVIRAADVSVVNLECPLIEQPSPIAKTGPTFGEASGCIAGIKQAGIRVVSLANNHIMDHGEAGLRNTMRVCREAGVDTVGAGANLQEARRIRVRDVGGVRIGLLAMAEHEFSIAGEAVWGANPLDLIDFVRNLRTHRADVDYLVVLLHGGFEFYGYPSPRIQTTCRFLVEMGANAVFVQHAHCLGGYEAYGGGLIFYGQGAVVMDEAIYRARADFHAGYLVRLTLAGTATPGVELIPFRQSDGRAGARRMPHAEAQQFLRDLEAKAQAIQDPAFVRAQWRAFCIERQHGYLSTVLGHGRILRRLNARGLLTRWLLGGRRLLGVRNMICCESHREVLESVFDDHLRNAARHVAPQESKPR